MKGMLKKALAGVAAAALAVTGLTVGASSASATTVSSANITLVGDASDSGRTFNAYKIGDYASVDFVENKYVVSLTTATGWADDIVNAIQTAGLTGAYEVSEYYGNPAAYVTTLTDGNLRTVAELLATAATSKTADISDNQMTKTSSGVTVPVTDDGYYLIVDSMGSPILVGSPAKIGDGEYTDEIGGETVGVAYLKPTTAPTPEKTIDDVSITSNGSSVNIGDKVPFKVTSTITGTASYSKYSWTVTDTADPGLKVDTDTIKVTLTKDGENPVTVPLYNEDESQDLYYTVTGPTRNASNKYVTTVTVNNVAGYDGWVLTVSYKAEVTSEILTNGVTGSAKNEATVSQNNGAAGAPGSQTVYTYGFDFQKVKASDGTGLAGATFQITKDGDSTPLMFTKTTMTIGETEVTVYVYDADGAQANTDLVSGSDGMIYVAGLAEGTYVVSETQAPAGYFQTGLPSFKVVISNKTVDFQSGSDTFGLVDGIKDDTDKKDRDVTVANMDSITQLPQTGAAGIALFVVLGLLIAGAGAAVWMKSRNVRNAING